MTFCPNCHEFGFYAKTCPKCGQPMHEKERLSKPFRHYNPRFPEALTDGFGNIIEDAGGDE